MKRIPLSDIALIRRLIVGKMSYDEIYHVMGVEWGVSC